MTSTGIIFLIVGALTLFLGVTGLSNKSRKGQRMVRLLGESGARVFYILLSIALIVGAFFV